MVKRFKGETFENEDGHLVLYPDYEDLAAELAIFKRIAERLESENTAISAKLVEAEATLRTAGVCMSCVYGAPEAYGCSDCLNTGWDGGTPTGYVPEARVAELEKALAAFAEPRNWVVNGRFDPNSGNFDATSFARAALSVTKEPKS